MKARMTELGKLVVEAETPVESFALGRWKEVRENDLKHMRLGECPIAIQTKLPGDSDE